jgi:hypothetical protein
MLRQLPQFTHSLHSLHPFYTHFLTACKLTLRLYSRWQRSVATLRWWWSATAVNRASISRARARGGSLRCPSWSARICSNRHIMRCWSRATRLLPSHSPTCRLFQNRTPFESCIPADLLQAWLPQGIADADLDAVRLMLAYAEARGFPALVVDGYTIHGDLAGWLTAAQQLAGTPAIALATRLLHALDTVGTPTAPTHNTTLRNGDASLTPSQLT